MSWSKLGLNRSACASGNSFLIAEGAIRLLTRAFFGGTCR